MQITTNNELKNQILMQQVGGQEIRLGVVWNKHTILDVFSVNDGDIVIQFTPTVDYIKEEFFDYGHDINQAFRKIVECKSISRQSPKAVNILCDEKYHKKILTDTNHIVEIINDDIFISSK